MYDVPSSSRIFPTAFFVLLLAGFALLLAPTSVVAQLGGENVRGDVGLKSGSQAPPGWYIGDMFYFYGTDEIRLNNGDALSGPKLNLFGDFLLINYVSKKKLLGADYGFAVGRPADIVIVNAQSPEQAIAEIAQPLAVFKHGRQTVVWHPPQLLRPRRN